MSHNPHIPRLTESAVECSAPGCSHIWYVGSDAVERAKERTPRDPVAFFTSIWGNHSRQFEPGGAPDITVEWEIVAHCSVCPDKVGDVVTNDSESVVCNECGTTWGMDGESGETDEYALEEIREAAHEEAISHAEWLIAGRDNAGNIRMRSGRGTLVANKGDGRDLVQGWFDRSRPGHYREQYRAALELLNREAAQVVEELVAEAPLYPSFTIEETRTGFRVEGMVTGPMWQRFIDRTVAAAREPSWIETFMDRDALANVDRERERERIMSHLARVPAPVPSMPRHLAVFYGSGRGYGKRAAMRAAGAFRHFPGLPVLDPYADPVGDVRAIVAKWGRNLANGIGSRFVVSHAKAPGALAAAALGPVRLGMDFGVVDSPIMCLYPDGSVRPLEDAE